MSPEIATLARHRLHAAREALRDSEYLLERGAYKGALNRLYYAAFNAARALLATRQLDSAKHSGVIALFQQHFVKSGLIEPDVARALPRAFELRLDVDYADYSAVTVEDAGKTRTAVRAFVDRCERVLEQLLKDSET